MILMIDNYDSFTYNLVQLVLAAGVEIEVVRNDVAGVGDLLGKGPRGIIISPGPGRPEAAGVGIELVRAEPRMPLLGVCLGHQILGAAYGAEIGRAEHLMHGKTSQIRHQSVGIFNGLPDPFEATRYHSLEVRAESLPEVFEATAWSDDGALQGMRHRDKPYWGVQFHPESVMTTAGPRLVQNFLALCGEGS